MPIISESTYQAPFYMLNNHMETILPRLFRKVTGVNFQRERIETSDDDFLDLDWIRSDYDQLVILSHGLEGSSHRNYMKGMAKLFHKAGWDILAWNCRTCSGEMNRQLRLYHHGDTTDLGEVIDYATEKYNYQTIALVGFSMGGSMLLKYLGERSQLVPKQIKAGVAISVPCDLGACARILSDKDNQFYLRRFMGKLKEKILLKAAQFPGRINTEGIEYINDFYEFDTKFTAPLYGFDNASDFYHFASCGPLLKGIKVDSLILNAINDPMLSEECFPIEIAKNHSKVWLEMPEKGGHVGFTPKRGRYSWSERRALEFVSKHIHSA